MKKNNKQTNRSGIMVNNFKANLLRRSKVERRERIYRNISDL